MVVATRLAGSTIGLCRGVSCMLHEVIRRTGAQRGEVFFWGHTGAELDRSFIGSDSAAGGAAFCGARHVSFTTDFGRTRA